MQLWSRGCALLATNGRRVAISAVYIAIGFAFGVLVNYYGYLFENIRVVVDVRVKEENGNTSSALRQVCAAFDSSHSSNPYVVPNIVHYIWFSGEYNRELKFLHYLSITSAHKIQRPTEIVLHCDNLPTGQWWEKLWREVPIKIKYKRAPEAVHEQNLSHMFHSGDVAKLEVIMEYGGIYLDYDVIVVNSLDPLRQYDCTFGKEKPPKLIAGIIIARPNALFIRLMYESYRNNYRSLDWDYNCARVAYKIYEQRPDLVHVEPSGLTTPDWKDRHMLYDEVIDWHGLFVVHVMGHSDKTVYDPETIKGLNSTLGEVMRYIYYGSWKIIR